MRVERNTFLDLKYLVTRSLQMVVALDEVGLVSYQYRVAIEQITTVVCRRSKISGFTA